MDKMWYRDDSLFSGDIKKHSDNSITPDTAMDVTFPGNIPYSAYKSLTLGGQSQN